MRVRGVVAAIGGILIFNLVLGMVAYLMTAPTVTVAQGVTGSSPNPPRFDTLPADNAPGALRYSIADSWDRTNLTFRFNNCPSSINCEDGQYAVRQGFVVWQEVSALRFTEVGSRDNADIEVTWTSNAPELGTVGDVLAFAYLPRDGGDLFIDDVEPWTVGDGSPFDLILVAAHEIGHTIGLDHSDDPYALMYPVLTGYVSGLGQDDITAAQVMYGAPNAPEPAAPAPPPVDYAPINDVATGFISDEVPYEIYEIEVITGETVTITMTADNQGDLSPYLGLLTPDEEVVLDERGDNQNTGQAQIVHTFDQAGTYVIYATRYGVEDGDTAGGYELTVASNIQGTSSSAPPPVGDNTYTLTISNNSGIEVCYLYVSPTTEEYWGDDLLGENTTMPDQTAVQVAVSPGTYDIAAVDCNDNWLERYEIGVTTSLNVVINLDIIDVYR